MTLSLLRSPDHTAGQSRLAVLFPLLAGKLSGDTTKVGLCPGIWRVAAQVLPRGGAWKASLLLHEPHLGPQALNSADTKTVAVWEWALPPRQS